MNKYTLTPNDLHRTSFFRVFEFHSFEIPMYIKSISFQIYFLVGEDCAEKDKQKFQFYFHRKTFCNGFQSLIFCRFKGLEKFQICTNWLQKAGITHHNSILRKLSSDVAFILKVNESFTIAVGFIFIESSCLNILNESYMVVHIWKCLHFTLKSKYHHFCIFLESPAWFLRNMCKAQRVPISFTNRARFTTELLLALQYMSMWSYFKVTHKTLVFTFPNFQMKQCNCSILPKSNYKIKTNQPSVEMFGPCQIHDIWKTCRCM